MEMLNSFAIMECYEVPRKYQTRCKSCKGKKGKHRFVSKNITFYIFGKLSLECSRVGR